MAYYMSHMMNLFEGLKITVTLAEKILKEHDPAVVALAVERTLAWYRRKNDASGLLGVLEHKETWKDMDPWIVEANAEYRLDRWYKFCGGHQIFKPWQYIEDEDLRAELRQEQYEAHYA